MANIEEILCEAIDTIVEKRIQDLHYDITKSCTIIDDSKRNNGEYVVSDGAINFNAYSTNIGYRKGDNVLVNIPNGDYNMQKTIIAKQAETSSIPFNYTSPLESMIKVRDSKNLDDNLPLIVKSFVPYTANAVGSFSGQNYKNAIGKGYDTADRSLISTTSSNGYIKYTFNLSDIPENVRIGKISCKVNAKLEKLASQDDYSVSCSLYASNALKSKSINLTMPEVDQIISIDTKDFVRNELDNLALRIDVDRCGFAIHGATLYIEYYAIDMGLDDEEYIQNSVSLLANDDNTITYKKIYESTNMYNLNYTRLGISADFQSWFNENLVQSGTYGLKIYLYTKKSDDSDDIYEFNFTSQEMIGNPYSFESFFNQERVFDISNVSSFYKISIYFYQSNNFIDEQNNRIKYKYSIGDGIEQKYPDNLFVTNLNVFYGYDKKEFDYDKIDLYNLNSAYYDLHNSDDSNVKNLGINWIHKLDSDNYTVITKMENDFGNFEVHWYYYDGQTLTSPYAGIGWKELEEYKDALVIKYTPDKIIQQNKIKVIGVFKPIDDSEDILNAGAARKSTGQKYYSNILTLENLTEIPSSATLQASTALEIFFNDGKNGNYFLYDQNGKIVNDVEGPGRIRTLTVKYLGEELTKDSGILESLTWYIPYPNYQDINNESVKTSMIKPIIGADTQYKKEENQLYYQGLNYRVYTLLPNTEGKFDNLEYAIYDLLTPMKVNNTIRCILKMNGISYEATKELMFAKMGTNGSNFNFMLNFNSAENGIYIDGTAEEKKIAVQALLFNSATGEPLAIDTSGNKLKWAWKTGSRNSLVLDPSGEYCTVEYNSPVTSSLNLNNYNILECTYKYSPTIQLQAYLQIPLKMKGYSFIEGAKEIMYNHQGSPYYYKNPYRIFSSISNAEIKRNLGWELRYEDKVIQYVNIADNYYNFSQADIDLQNKLKNYLPTLKTSQIGGITYCGLCAPALYLVGYENNICINCLETDSNSRPLKTLWSQPILITQSSYDFDILNNWDGTLQLDEENGTIMSTMLGAGKKVKDDNTFSGVLIGDIKEGTDKEDTEALTGVYGFNHGVLSYGLREDGTAFLGRKGRGQILFDGENGSIKSAKWDAVNQQDQEGLYLDLDDGIIESKGNSGQRFYLNPQSKNGNNFQLIVNGKDSNSLINITSKTNKEDYYIQSSGYQDKIEGTKLDLLNGTFESYSENGGLKLSTKTGDEYFKVFSKNGGSDIPLISMGNKGYYLQSKGYTGQKQSTIIYGGKTYNLYQYKYDDNNASQNFKYFIYERYEEEEVKKARLISQQDVVYLNRYIGIRFEGSTSAVLIFDQGNQSYLGEVAFSERIIVDKDNIIQEEISSANRKKSFISKLVPIYENTDPEGIKIDLDHGIIDGYNLYLRGKSSGKGQFILDSTANEYPLQIQPIINGQLGQSTFSINWNGELTCSKVISLNNDGRNDRPISINNNFYVDERGNIGGGSASFGSGNFGGGWFGGTANLANRAQNATYSTYVDYLGSESSRISSSDAKDRVRRIVSESDEDGATAGYKFTGASDSTDGLRNVQNASGILQTKNLKLEQITSTDGKNYTVLGVK